MSDRLFLYIDILGFKELIESGGDVFDLFQTIDELNVHNDNDFHCIVFSDTILVYGDDRWLSAPSQAVMWLVEFAQDLFYRLIVKDIHFRAYITIGDFHHYKLNNIEAYYGQALVDCYTKEKDIQCVGVFIDNSLVKYSDIFHTNKFDDNCHFVHVMQHLDQISAPYNSYPLSGYELKATGMEWWTVYLLRYLETIYHHGQDASLSERVRQKHRNAWAMISTRHGGLLQRLVTVNFDFASVVEIDWTEPLARIGTPDGAWG